MTMWQIEENERWRRDPKWDAFFSRVHQLTIITICESSILFYHCLKSWWIRQETLIIQLPTKQSWKSIELCTNLTVSDKLREERSSECAECDSSPWSNWAIQEQWQRTHTERHWTYEFQSVKNRRKEETVLDSLKGHSHLKFIELEKMIN